MLKRLIRGLRFAKTAVKIAAKDALYRGKTLKISELFGGIELSNTVSYEAYLRVISGKVWASWKCLDIIANSVAATEVTLVRKGGTEEVKIRDLQRLLEYPNEGQTWRQLIYVTIMHFRGTGMAFWYKSEADASGDRPRNLYSLNPKSCRLVLDSQNGIKGFVFHINGRDVPFDPEEIIYFCRPNPNKTFHGLGDIEAGKDLFDEHINRNKINEHWYANGANPSGIIFNEESSQDSDDYWKTVKAQWQKEYGGTRNAGKTAWLIGGGKWRYQQVGLSQRDMQQIEQSQWNVEQICLLHGVPLSVIGLRDSANYATADIDNQRFKEYTVLPDVKMLEDTINTDLVAGFDDRASLVFSVSGLIDVKRMMEGLGPLFDRGGCTINEMRKICGLTPDEERPDWNETYISAGLVPTVLAGIADLDKTEEEAKRAVNQFLKSQTQE